LQTPESLVCKERISYKLYEFSSYLTEYTLRCRYRDQPLNAVYYKKYKIKGFEVLTEVIIKSSIFWDITPHSLLKDNRRFGGACSLYLFATYFHAGLLLGLFFDREDGGAMCLRKVGHFQLTTRRYIPEDRTLDKI
jgi:hypothetical protein